MKKQKSASFWVAIALILCLISSLGASMVQTGGGAIKYHDITMVTDSGHELDALLLVPKNATRENPAPAIVTSHGSVSYTHLDVYKRQESCSFSKSDDVQWMAVDGFAFYDLHLL